MPSPAVWSICLVAVVSAAPSALPKLNIDPAAVSLSGISSGADFVGQYVVAYSNSIKGIGVFAGQAPHCAVHKFPSEPLIKGSDPSVPYCDGCPPGYTIGYDHCKRTPSIQDGAANVDALVNYFKNQSNAGTIDPLSNLQDGDKKIFLYRGKSDSTYKKGSVNTTANFFRKLVPKTNVYFETKVDSEHLVPGVDPYLCWWEEWSGPDNCTYDGAGHALKWIYGDAAFAKGGRDNDTAKLAALLQPFDQKQFFAGENGGYLADEGEIFIPDDCLAGRAAAGATATGAEPCKLHLFFHGCGVKPSYPVFTEYAGFNEWAMYNKMVVVYPKMSTKGPTAQLKSGCFDGYGQTGIDYDLKTGPQMKTVANMIASLVGKST